MDLVTRQKNVVVFGFDSAWTDNPKAPGAICAITFNARGQARFLAPRATSFSDALRFIEVVRTDYDLSLVALDQPTIVPNLTGSRPVDKVAAALVSFVGGGVQPANRSKIGMFCDDAPIWTFIASLGAVQSPLVARAASHGHFLIEVFPALSLPSLDDRFALRMGAPKYNPANRGRFRMQDWRAVVQVVGQIADDLGLTEMVAWVQTLGALDTPRKADQDRLDAVICALVGLLWRSGRPETMTMLGDLTFGYMVAPISTATRSRLQDASQRRSVAMT
jgi:predicted RNase H-like nuclease